ncbi:WG repeat-containing protein [Moraxella nasovis]|uniref:WG repeat-containing protein n=1 Tax=Moraxella nasovis TaxID=2904121 RepID=UPI001F620BCE|nr:WG repeat-containing protein [Moraxella nasovis]UNU73524.1 WG repeat-containing protein [Moraxella nasovis]
MYHLLYECFDKGKQYKGYIDKTGKVVVPIKYDVYESDKYLLLFSDGMARVWLNDKSFYINKQGKCVQYTINQTLIKPIVIGGLYY